MELIWVAWAVFGLIVGVILGVLVERERNEYNDSIPDDYDNVGKCDGMDRPDPTPEEISTVLYLLRMGASRREKKVIDYLIDKEGEEDEAY